jgi:hypothetical protein
MKTRQEKIDRMVEAVNDWDIDTLVGHVQDQLLDTYDSLGDVEIDDEYKIWFGDEDDLEDDGIASSTGALSDFEQKCGCDIDMPCKCGRR